MPKAPDKMIFYFSGINESVAREAALLAVEVAKREAPKLSGAAANGIKAIYGPNYFGLTWSKDYLWIQNAGARPFTMKSLAGKTIPMWIDDPIGKEQQKNPKAKTRITASGKTQVLIFRKAASLGQKKLVKKKVKGVMTQRSVPASYPGAPGRIALREAQSPFTTDGKIAGAIAKGNGGVRWRFPGLAPRGFFQQALREASSYYRLQGSIVTEYNSFDGAS
jgi:hypothetical protein